MGRHVFSCRSLLLSTTVLNDIYLFFCVGYTISVSFIEFLRKFCVYDENFDVVLY